MKFKNLFLISVLVLTFAGVYGFGPQGGYHWFEKKGVITLKSKASMEIQEKDMRLRKNLRPGDEVSNHRMACVFKPGMDSCTLALEEH